MEERRKSSGSEERHETRRVRGLSSPHFMRGWPRTPWFCRIVEFIIRPADRIAGRYAACSVPQVSSGSCPGEQPHRARTPARCGVPRCARRGAPFTMPPA